MLNTTITKLLEVYGVLCRDPYAILYAFPIDFSIIIIISFDYYVRRVCVCVYVYIGNEFIVSQVDI